MIIYDDDGIGYDVVSTQSVKDAMAEIEKINEYDLPKDERTPCNIKKIVIDIIRKHTGVCDEMS